MARQIDREPQLTPGLPGYASQPDGAPARASRLWRAIVAILTPLASLKLTVVLFLMAIFIVFAGTLAQTEKDIWQVVHDYFRMDLRSGAAAVRSALAWIDLRIFFPRSFFPNLAPIPWGYGFWFPSGWLIGFLLFLNLTAAHLIRFRVQGRGRALLVGLAILAGGVLLTVAVIMAGSQQAATQRPLFADWPSLRILWLLVQCTSASLVLLLGSALIFRRRAGIVVLHAGVGLMMFGELIVGISAVEGRMQIIEGQTVDHVLDTRELELAIVDTSDPEQDDVMVIPQARLLAGTVIRDPQLPCDVEIVEFQLNSERQPADPAEPNLATAGRGRQERAVPVAPISGTDSSGAMNRSAAYVRLLQKEGGADLGVYLVGLDDWFAGASEAITVDGRQYDMSLRFKHMYKPYSMHLIDVQQDVYMGTQTPRSYSSTLRLVDPTRNVDRTVRIWMNNPLRFAGETFYQSSYGRDSRTGLEYTGLQVVTNTGWRIPYVSCMMLAVGMLAQFGITLYSYLKRRRDLAPVPRVDTAGAQRQRTGGAFALAVVMLSAVWLMSRMYAPAPAAGQLDLDACGRLPIMFEGRIKPLDSLARNSLRIISDREVYQDSNRTTQPAIRWLLDVITDSPDAEKQRVIRIQNLELLDTLKLPRRQGFRYAIEEIAPQWDVFTQQASQARQTAPDQRGVYEKKVLELEQRLSHYIMLRESFTPAPLRPENLREDLAQEANRREQNSRHALPLAVPPKDPKGEWQPYSYAAFDALARSIAASQGLQVEDPSPATLAWSSILSAYGGRASEATTFNRNVQAYWKLLCDNPPQWWNPAKTDFEAAFNHAAPFYYAMLLYIGAFLLGCFSWLGWSVPLRRACTWLTLFTLVVHTLALVGRIYISGRPPITSLYSSALFVGWAGVVLALVLEFYSRIGVANVVGAFLGFATLLISVLMTTTVAPFKGDSFTVLVAVLDTQFWLATHVTCITAGYSATLLAGLLGVMYIVRGVLTPSQDKRIAQETSRMVYGTLCFAIFFSFFGTVLGGLWADDAWGRFWGWDPKENGALIIVLWISVVLHAYWGRMVRERGLSVLAVVGNIVTAWSWFGVNELGVGLHSYGFTEGVLLVLGLVVAAHLAIIALGLVPVRYWRSRLTSA